MVLERFLNQTNYRDNVIKLKMAENAAIISVDRKRNS